MDEFFPKPMFSARHEFLGTLSKDNDSADSVHIVVQYSLIKEGAIIGKALGTKENYDKIIRFLNCPGPYLKLASEWTEPITTEISSKKILLGTTTHKPWPPIYGKGIPYFVSDLSLDDLTIRECYGNGRADYIERHLTFFLAGPRRFWSIHPLRELSATGEIKCEITESKIHLNEGLPFGVEIAPWYFYEQKGPPENHELTASVLTLHLKTNATVKELSSSAFLELGRALVDDLCLLVSFLSKRWVTWYRYQLITSEGIESHIRRTRGCLEVEPDPHESSIEYARTRDFLRIAFSNLRKLRSEGINLFMPIVYFVAGNEARYVEERFTTFFLSLERIKDMFALREGVGKNLPDRAFESLAGVVSDVIEKNIESSDARERIEKKIPELNRPSLRFLLDILFSRLGIEWRDIYPSGSEFTLIRTRDKLFHSSVELNLPQLVKEMYRLRTIVERILLRMLGWEDVSRSPSRNIGEWLSGAEG